MAKKLVDRLSSPDSSITKGQREQGTTLRVMYESLALMTRNLGEGGICGLLESPEVQRLSRHSKPQSIPEGRTLDHYLDHHLSMCS